MKVNSISDIMVQEIDSILVYRSEKEDLLKTVFERSRTVALEDVNKLLEDVRSKKEQGTVNLGVY